MCVINILKEASDGRLHQNEEGEFPGEIHHQGDHTHSLDKSPQEHIDIETHCSSHQVGISRQPGRDFTYADNE